MSRVGGHLVKRTRIFVEKKKIDLVTPPDHDTYMGNTNVKNVLVDR
jgi:hypothetical protein